MYGEYGTQYYWYRNSYDIDNDPNRNNYAILFNIDTGEMRFTGRKTTREEIIEKCKLGGASSKVCGTLIKYDGWNVSKDYPWL